MKTQKLCNNNIVGEGTRGKPNEAIKAIEEKIKVACRWRERDPLINRTEIAAGYKIIRPGKLENTQAYLNQDA